MKAKVFLLGIALLLLTADAAQSQVRLKADLMQILSLEPGQEQTVEVTLESVTDEDVDVEIYQTDYHFLPGQQKQYLRPDSLEYSNATWIAYPDDYITVPAGASVTTYYTVSVPENVRADGSYWSMLMFQPTVNRVNAATVEGDEMVVRSNVRYGIQVVTNIGSTGVPDFDIQNLRTIERNGEPLLVADVTNSGSLGIAPHVWLEVFNENGEKVSVLDGQFHILYPSTGITYGFSLDGLDRGNYSAMLLVDGRGRDLLFGSRVNFTIE